jgi:hypothetical protein
MKVGAGAVLIPAINEPERVFGMALSSDILEINLRGCCFNHANTLYRAGAGVYLRLRYRTSTSAA